MITIFTKKRSARSSWFRNVVALAAALLIVPAYGFCITWAGDSIPARLSIQPFSFDLVINLARDLARVPYIDPNASQPDAIRNITREQWEKISWHSEARLWHDEGLPFEISFHHAGAAYSRTVLINIVEDDIARPFAFTPAFFDYPNKELPAQLVDVDAGFAGFTLFQSFDTEKGPDELREKDEIASFLGASYFRSRGRQSRYGIHARGLAVNTAHPDGEEFPYFREFWLEKPVQGATSIVIYALMDSPSITGAFRMEFIPGTSTITDVDARFFPRPKSGTSAKLGFAPLTSMFLYSETDNGRTGDYRPEVHNSDGLLFQDAQENWHWVPLSNPERLAVSRFSLENPRLLGLMQRDNVFDHYQDLAARYDRRPSLMVEPQGQWGAGQIELFEIPASEDFHSNIVAFWTPSEETLAAANNEKDDGFALAYRLYWMTPGVTPHDLGRATATRMRMLPANDAMQFIVDFEGEKLNSLPADTGLACVLEVPEQYPVLERRLEKNEVTSGWRLVFTVRCPPKKGLLGGLLNRSSGNDSHQFKAMLKRGENLPESLTETWIFDLHH